MIKEGSLVQLKADSKAAIMKVEQVAIACDGTGGDGIGLLCSWFEDGEVQQAWLSESAVTMLSPTRTYPRLRY